MQKTKIEWCDYSLNPVKGICPVGCYYCYATRLYRRFGWNPEIRFDVQPLFDVGKIKTPSRIFVGSTMELFGEWIKPEWIHSILFFCKAYSEHTFIFLTKCPEHFSRWPPFPQNAYVGVSVTNQEQYDKAIHYLKNVQASVKFLSFEPLLEHISGETMSKLTDAGISWVIIGCQTPKSLKTMPKFEWVKEIVDAADKARIPAFLKNNLIPLLPLQIRKEIWGQVVLRQEFPGEVTGIP